MSSMSTLSWDDTEGFAYRRQFLLSQGICCSSFYVFATLSKIVIFEKGATTGEKGGRERVFGRYGDNSPTHGSHTTRLTTLPPSRREKQTATTTIRCRCRRCSKKRVSREFSIVDFEKRGRGGETKNGRKREAKNTTDWLDSLPSRKIQYIGPRSDG